MLRIATAAYPLSFLTSWGQYEDKLASWVAEASDAGAKLLVFPEYGAMELATLDGLRTAQDLEASLFAVSEKLDDAEQVHKNLAAEFDVHILAASGPCATNVRPVNQARLVAPNGKTAKQDKQIMTRFEREIWNVQAGNGLQVFETTIGRIGVLICYDSEFPLLARALKACDILLVPSCTEALSGYWRVRIGAMARALETQCVAVMASLVGKVDWSEAVDVSTGTGGIFGPPDVGFPQTGVIAEGVLNQAGWTYGEVDLQSVERVRRDGIVLGQQHWPEQNGRDSAAPVVNLV